MVIWLFRAGDNHKRHELRKPELCWLCLCCLADGMRFKASWPAGLLTTSLESFLQAAPAARLILEYSTGQSMQTVARDERHPVLSILLVSLYGTVATVGLGQVYSCNSRHALESFHVKGHTGIGLKQSGLSILGVVTQLFESLGTNILWQKSCSSSGTSVEKAGPFVQTTYRTQLCQPVFGSHHRYVIVTEGEKQASDS